MATAVHKARCVYCRTDVSVPDTYAHGDHELRKARRNIGIGANGLWIAIGFAIWQVALNEQPIDFDLAWQTVAVALVIGFALELLNYLFWSKRRAISRLTAELEEARADGRQLQQKIRDASRG
jgi:hypothetical protein